jgi:tetratricopeptide (TPR) repeat protein
VEQGPHDEREAALRPLRTIGAVVASLRRGGLPPDEERSAVIQVASAVEMSLRRVLRDHPDVALPVRLRALAPDELGADEVLAELRQHDRISIELAASVHDLLELRRGLREGRPLGPSDGASAYRVADLLEREVAEPVRPSPSTGSLATEALPAADATVLYPADQRTDEPPTRRGNRLYWAAGAVLLLLLVPLGLWLGTRGGGDEEMERGIALFRSAAYADAASHFFRYSQANPEDPTPHLYLARIHRRLKRYDLAVPELEKALELAPDDAAAHTELGLLLTDTRHYDDAVGRFREALRLDSDADAAWVGLVRALRAAGREDLAGGELARAPADVRAMLTRPAPR